MLGAIRMIPEMLLGSRLSLGITTCLLDMRGPNLSLGMADIEYKPVIVMWDIGFLDQSQLRDRRGHLSSHVIAVSRSPRLSRPSGINDGYVKIQRSKGWEFESMPACVPCRRNGYLQSADSLLHHI